MSRYLGQVFTVKISFVVSAAGVHWELEEGEEELDRGQVTR